MFCTLKQAADKLETTEAEIETMLNDGVLREFRDGSRRLLKVADLADVTVAARRATSDSHPARTQLQVEAPPAEIDIEAFTLPEPEIRLPSSGAVATKASPPHAATKRSPRPAPKPVVHKRAAHSTVAHKPVATQRRRDPPRAVVVSPPIAKQRPRPQTYEMSLREWLWIGLLDDSLLAIFIIFGIVLLGAGAVAGTLYLLTQAL
jgi:hypothetical protein